MSHYEDDFGNVVHKAINRPAICHFLYEYLPLIDEHNKQRQNLLNLERCWCTKDPWMRLLTTTLGMCIVDMHRWYRNKKYDDAQQEECRGQSVSNELLAIRKFSDRLCVGLERKGMIDRSRGSSRPVAGRYRLLRQGEEATHDLLQRITRDGSATRDATEKQMRKENRSVGSAHKASCFICRKFLKRNDIVNYQHTIWQCKTCQMPLCKMSRVDATIGRTDTCIYMHLHSSDGVTGCSGLHSSSKAFPKELQVSLYPRRSNRGNNN